MIELTKDFTPATDEVWRLQTQKHADCLFFQQMSRHGHYGDDPEHSQQGIYVCSPSGKFLASINSNSADRVMRMMQRGLDAWEKLPEEERKLPADAEIKAAHRWEDSYPEGGLVISVVTRDLPSNCDPDADCEVKWNRDFIWFSKEEARSWIPDYPAADVVHEIPRDLAQRITRFHLVDTVNGQTTPYRREDVEDTTISTRITDIKADGTNEGGIVELEIFGSTKTNSPGRQRRESPHGVVTRLLGHAKFDFTKMAFVEFEMVALGRRWGYTQFNFRRNEEEQGPLGYVFKLASEKTPRVAPAFIYAYDADWVKR